MKKILTLIVTLIFATAVFAGCGTTDNTGGGNDGGAAGQSIDSAKTLADLNQFESYGYTYSDKNYVCVVMDGETYYRATAEIPEDVSEELSKLNWDNADYDQKLAELVGPLKISNLENLNDQMLSEEDLDKLAGKTGKELIDDGWVYSGGYDTDSSVVYMEKGPFQYAVTVDGTIEESDDIDIVKEIESLKVKSVSFLNLASSVVDADE